VYKAIQVYQLQKLNLNFKKRIRPNFLYGRNMVVNYFNREWRMYKNVANDATDKTLHKQEGHDGPEVAHLYKGTRSGTSLNPRAFI
jgi:hypothetical protein